MTKRELIEKLKNVSDDAIIGLNYTHGDGCYVEDENEACMCTDIRVTLSAKHNGKSTMLMTEEFNYETDIGPAEEWH